MPIRHGGTLASRHSSWPRDHFCRSTPVLAYEVKRGLADIDADHGHRTVECLRHGVLLALGTTCELHSLVGREPRTIPLADVRSEPDAANSTIATEISDLPEIGRSRGRIR